MRSASHRGRRASRAASAKWTAERSRSTSSWSAAASRPCGATFGRLVAKIPARRADVALDRLARLYAAEHREDESAAAFFNRVDVVQVKKLLADLEPLSAETATKDDFIDLAETTEFRPETTEGECAV